MDKPYCRTLISYSSQTVITIFFRSSPFHFDERINSYHSITGYIPFNFWNAWTICFSSVWYCLQTHSHSLVLTAKTLRLKTDWMKQQRQKEKEKKWIGANVHVESRLQNAWHMSKSIISFVPIQSNPLNDQPLIFAVTVCSACIVYTLYTVQCIQTTGLHCNCMLFMNEDKIQQF